MAALIKFAVLLVAITMVASQRVKEIPPNVPLDLPWIPHWVPCEFDFEAYKKGPACNDCSSTVHCTPVGGIVRNCFGYTPYCINGKCSQVPTPECVEVEFETATDYVFN